MKPWTILVYMAADNDLGPYAFWDLYEMEAAFGEATRRAGSTPQLDVVVQLDAPGAGGLARYHMFQGTRPFVTKRLEDFRRADFASVESPLVETLPEANSADPATLESFLAWGAERYPSENLMVVLWGHGSGWSPKPRRHREGSDAKIAAGGIAFDDTSRDVMAVGSLAERLKDFVKNARGGRKIDVLSMDACLMQMAEVLTELAPTARYAVGTTDIQSHLGLPYRRLLWEMNKNSYLGLKRSAPPTADDAYLVAKMIPTLFKASLNGGRSTQGRVDADSYKTLTSSSYHLGELESELVRKALPQLARALEAWMLSDSIRTLDVRAVLGQMDARSYQGSAQDLGAFSSLVRQLLDRAEVDPGKFDRPTENLRKALNDVDDALRRAVVATAFGSDYTKPGQDLFLLGYRGLSMWLPPNAEELRARYPDFSTSTLYRTTNWGQWLRRAYR